MKYMNSKYVGLILVVVSLVALQFATGKEKSDSTKLETGVHYVDKFTDTEQPKTIEVAQNLKPTPDPISTPTVVKEVYTTAAETRELQKQLIALTKEVSKMTKMHSDLMSENNKLRNSMTDFDKKKEKTTLIDDSLDEKYTWVSDPTTGWPRPTRTVWQRTQVGQAAILECIVRDGKPVPTGAITINGHQGGYTGGGGGGGRGGAKGGGQPMSRQKGIQIIRGGR